MTLLLVELKTFAFGNVNDKNMVTNDFDTRKQRCDDWSCFLPDSGLELLWNYLTRITFSK